MVYYPPRQFFYIFIIVEILLEKAPVMILLQAVDTFFLSVSSCAVYEIKAILETAARYATKAFDAD